MAALDASLAQRAGGVRTESAAADDAAGYGSALHGSTTQKPTQLHASIHARVGSLHMRGAVRDAQCAHSHIRKSSCQHFMCRSSSASVTHATEIPGHPPNDTMAHHQPTRASLRVRLGPHSRGFAWDAAQYWRLHAK
eukprot:7261965-Prymnesium_polylepis.2